MARGRPDRVVALATASLMLLALTLVCAGGRSARAAGGGGPRARAAGCGSRTRVSPGPGEPARSPPGPGLEPAHRRALLCRRAPPRRGRGRDRPAARRRSPQVRGRVLVGASRPRCAAAGSPEAASCAGRSSREDRRAWVQRFSVYSMGGGRKVYDQAVKIFCDNMRADPGSVAIVNTSCTRSSTAARRPPSSRRPGRTSAAASAR